MSVAGKRKPAPEEADENTEMNQQWFPETQVGMCSAS